MTRSDPPFEITGLPLEGVQLVEASAGTGKTFSIAGLYTRLVAERGASVRDIVVMTFTRAATRELRERIRRWLATAARIAADPDGADPDDPVDTTIAAIIEQTVAAGEARDSVGRRLRLAAGFIDEAAITTIHGFSQQAATEHAFDSALPFDRGEQVDDTEAFREAAGDYWRRRVIGAPPREAAAFTALWSGPAALFGQIETALKRPGAAIDGPDDGEIVQRLEAARSLWRDHAAGLRKALAAVDAAGGFHGGRGLAKAVVAAGGTDPMLDALETALFTDPPILPEWVALLAPDALEKQLTKKGGPAWRAAPPDPRLIGALPALSGLPRLLELRRAVAEVRRLAAARKRTRRQFSFDDMIAALHHALTADGGGNTLAEAMHRRRPWALVDEFQDTDPAQYEILQRIYRDREHGALIVVGDPKQAIYAFRGGDVFAYLRAARDAGQRHTLGVNHRSTPGLLAAVERLFTSAGNDPFLVDGIGFTPVAPGRSAGDRRLRMDGAEVPPLTIWPLLDEEHPRKADWEARLADATVARIIELLDPDRGSAFVTADGEHRPAAPGDIAVLVNSNAQATEMQRRLARRGVPAVCLHQQSVFETTEAEEMERVVRAVAAPADEDAVRAALSTPLLGFRLSSLMALANDEDAWQQELDRFQAAHQRWQSAGILAALRPIIQAAGPRLLALEDGERRVANHLQLAELLQQADGETFGADGLLRWLAEARRHPRKDDSAEHEQLRLESDEDLVRIATIHKAKGLQYPVVFLPFTPWLGTGGTPHQPPYVFHRDGGARIDYLAGNEDASARRAVLEHRAEALRLLYVALTRAEQACFLAWGVTHGAANAALATLLHRGDGIDPADWNAGNASHAPLTAAAVRHRLDTLAAGAGGAIEITDPPRLTGRHRHQAVPPRALTGARTDRPAPRPPWSVLSYSRLVAHAGYAVPVQGADDESRDPDERTAPATAAPRAAEEAIPVLPRGAAFGTAVHALLEGADFARWPAPGEDPDPRLRTYVATALRNHGIRPGNEGAPEAVAAAVVQLIARCLHTPLPGIGPLSAVPAHRRRAELEFVLGLATGATGVTEATEATGAADAGALMDRLEAAGYTAPIPAERRGQVLRGLLHGFIDLVVENEGRYYVVDYKTNDLGPHRADYAPAPLAAAIRHGHYDLQYLLYLVALHRHLGHLLPDYAAHRHLGGALYLFPRGMDGNTAGHGVFTDTPPPELVLELDDLLAGRSAASAGNR